MASEGAWLAVLLGTLWVSNTLAADEPCPPVPPAEIARRSATVPVLEYEPEPCDPRRINPARRDACAGDGHPPYLAPAEVFGISSIGRGEANWYTGAAGLMYRLIVEVLLGVERRGQALVLAPQLPQGWPGFRLQYRYRDTTYAIEVRAAEAGALLIDGQHVAGNTVQLVDDGAHHRVELQLARRQGTAVSAEREDTQSKTTP